MRARPSRGRCGILGMAGRRERRSMKQSVIARGLAAGAAVLLAAALLGPARRLEGEAKADEAKPTVASGSGPLCVLKGTYPIPKGNQIFDAASGGRAIANFTGTYIPLKLSDIPADATNGRARLSTTS